MMPLLELLEPQNITLCYDMQMQIMAERGKNH